MGDFIEFFDYFDFLPIFFTKNITSIVYGELPEFGFLDQLFTYLDIFGILFYTHFIFPLYYYQ
jgi:hypothetical protein